MPSIGGWEWIIILVIVIIIFGAGKLSDIGGALGKSIREFRESSTGDAEVAANGKDKPVGDESVNEGKA